MEGKHSKLWFWVMLAVFCIGTAVGAICTARTGTQTDTELKSYLERFMQGYLADQSRFSVFLQSLKSSLRIFLCMFFAAFFRLGIAVLLTGVFCKGFSCGFTAAAFAKYYGVRGMLMPAASAVSNLIYLPMLLFFATAAANSALKKQKRDKNMLGSFCLFSGICLTTFCMKSFLDGYVTTTFIKLLIPFVTIV